MLLVGIVAKRKDIKAIKKELKNKNIEIIHITKESIRNIKNIKFDEIIFLQNINLENEEYEYMSEVISNVKFLILNGDTEINVFSQLKVQRPIKLITFGFNSKSTITISSVKDEKIIVYIQRDIEKTDGEILEMQEKEIINKDIKNIYDNFVVFIIKELHNS